MIHRYEPGHGYGGEYMGMEENPEGHWCAYEDVAPLEAEVARLLDENGSLRTIAQHEKSLLDTERAAHEATKAELKQARDYAVSCSTQSQEDSARREAAEQRVAELERRLALRRETVVELKADRDDAEAALSSARALLERAPEAAAIDQWWTDRDAWLRAHPEPATPCPECGMTVQHKLQCSRRGQPLTATPAATGAEPKLLLSTYPGCRSGRDGECFWEECPQLRDGEPARSGRHCPRDLRHDDE